jgi:hypothetical protein
MSREEELAEILKRKSEDMRNTWQVKDHGDPGQHITLDPKQKEMADSEVWEVRIRLIKAVAYLFVGAGIFLAGLAVVWLVRGA